MLLSALNKNASISSGLSHSDIQRTHSCAKRVAQQQKGEHGHPEPQVGTGWKEAELRRRAGRCPRKPTQRNWEVRSAFLACCFHLLVGGRCRTEPGGEGRDQIKKD